MVALCGQPAGNGLEGNFGDIFDLTNYGAQLGGDKLDSSVHQPLGHTDVRLPNTVNTSSAGTAYKRS